MENHEIFLQCDKLFSSNLSHSAQVRFGQLEWYNRIIRTIRSNTDFIINETLKILSNHMTIQKVLIDIGLFSVLHNAMGLKREKFDGLSVLCFAL